MKMFSCLMPNLQRLLARRLEFFALADVGRERDDFGVVVVLQPLQDDGGVEAARVGEHDFLDIAHGELVWLETGRAGIAERGKPLF